MPGPPHMFIPPGVIRTQLVMSIHQPGYNPMKFVPGQIISSHVIMSNRINRHHNDVQKKLYHLGRISSVSMGSPPG